LVVFETPFLPISSTLNSYSYFSGHQFIIASLFSKLYAPMSLKAISETCFFRLLQGVQQIRRRVETKERRKKKTATFS
jgi:hypothetical protein